MDWTDSETQYKFSLETVKLAEDYNKARRQYGQARMYLHTELAKKWQDGSINQSHSLDKCLLELSNSDFKARSAYEAHLTLYENYRGLESVLEARKAHISLVQSLIKNRIGNE